MVFEEKIQVPSEVQAVVKGNSVGFKGPNGENFKEFKTTLAVVEKNNGEITIKGKTKARKTKAVVKAIKAHLKNMIFGVTQGFEFKLAIVYSHFPMNAVKKEGFVEVSNFLGSKKPVRARIVGGTQVEVKGKEITVKGVDKENVGQTAANIERITSSKGRDKRIFQDGIYIVSKG